MPLKNCLTRRTLYSYYPVVVLFCAIRLLTTFFQAKGVGSYILNAFLQIGIIFCLPLFIFSILNKEKPRESLKFFGFKKINIKAVLISIAIGIIVYVLNVFVASFFSSILSGIGYKGSGSSSTSSSYPVYMLIINLVCSALLPAICEESTHRGLLLNGLSPFGKNRAIIISAVLFGLLHLNIDQFFYATIIGFLLGYIVSTSESIYPAIIIHFMNNALSAFMSFSRVNGLAFHGMFSWINFTSKTNPFLAVVFIFLLITLLVILLKILLKVLFRQTIIKRTEILHNEIFNEIAKDVFLQELQEVVDGNTHTPKQRTLPFEEFETIYRKKGEQLGHLSRIESRLLADRTSYKVDVVTKTLIIASLALSAIVTIFSLLWGMM